MQTKVVLGEKLIFERILGGIRLEQVISISVISYLELGVI